MHQQLVLYKCILKKENGDRDIQKHIEMNIKLDNLRRHLPNERRQIIIPCSYFDFDVFICFKYVGWH